VGYEVSGRSYPHGMRNIAPTRESMAALETQSILMLAAVTLFGIVNIVSLFV